MSKVSKSRLYNFPQYPTDKSHPEYAAGIYLNCPAQESLLLVLLAAPELGHPLTLPYLTTMPFCRPYYRCRLPVCPDCGKNSAKRAAARMVRDMVDHLDEMDHVSWVTINCEVLDTIELAQIKAKRVKLRKKIQNLRRFKLRKTEWSGYFEVSPAENPILHLHALVYHPRQTRDELRSLLREAFPSDRAVHVSEWKTIDRIKEKPQGMILEGLITLQEFNVSAVARYSTKHFPVVPYVGVKRDGVFKKVPRTGTTKWIARWLIQTHLMKKDGLKCNGIRLGVRSVKGRRWNRSTRITRNENKEIIRLEYFRAVALALGSRETTPERLAEFQSLPPRPTQFDLDGGVMDVREMIAEIMNGDSDNDTLGDYDAVDWEPADEFDLISETLSDDLADRYDEMEWEGLDENGMAAVIQVDPGNLKAVATAVVEKDTLMESRSVSLLDDGMGETIFPDLVS
jgi:hypothetical protein